MSAPSLRIPLNAPEIFIAHIVATDREAIEHLNREIQKLKKFADDFCDAWALFDFCHHNEHQAQQEVAEFFLKWKLLAAREGAMTIQFFAKALENATDLLCKCEALLVNVDRTKLRSAREMLVSLVPEFEAVRDTSFREGELMNMDSAERFSSFNPQRLDGAEKGILRKRKYQNVFEGKLQSYQVNRQTYEGLIAVANEFYSAFSHYYKGTLAPEPLSPQPLERFVWWVRPD
jgi:hypothetical protein